MNSQKEEKHPVLSGIIIMIVAFIAVVPFSIFGNVAGSVETGTVFGRLIIGVLLIIIFRKYFHPGRSFSGIVYMVPALLFPLWNIVYHVTSGMAQLKSADAIPMAILSGLAPAVFEEVIFRGIMIGKLKESGKSKMVTLIISAVIFGLVHLTNIAGMQTAEVLVQTAYALVVGLVFGAVYIKSGDIISVIIAHALTDISSQIFLQAPSETPTHMIVVFCVVLIITAVYALRLVMGSGKDRGADVKQPLQEK